MCKVEICVFKSLSPFAEGYFFKRYLIFLHTVRLGRVLGQEATYFERENVYELKAYSSPKQTLKFIVWA